MAKIKFATYEIEDSLNCDDCIVGVDEAGRGPGAGPVTAGAVWIPKENLSKLLIKVKDSKSLSPKRREEMFDLIADTCKWSVASVDNKTIDQMNILNATKLAMKSAIARLEKDLNIDHLLIDGTVVLEDVWIPQTQVIRGDAKSISIAAASIMAKVTRDREMQFLHWIYPQYNFQKNKGYLTKEHITAIEMYGITPYHRKSFRKVSDYNG